MTTKTLNPIDAGLDLLAADEGRTRDQVAARLGVDREKADPRSVQNLTHALRGLKRRCLSARRDLPAGFMEAYRPLAELHARNVGTRAMVPKPRLQEGWAFRADGSGIEPAPGWQYDTARGGIKRVGAA